MKVSYVDILLAPDEALRSLKDRPVWGVALALACAMTIVGTILIVPAMQEALTRDWPSIVARTPALSSLDPALLKSRLQFSVAALKWAWVYAAISMFCVVLLQAAALRLAALVFKMAGTFKQYWAVACNVAIVAGFAALTRAAIVVIAGAENFRTADSVKNAIPSLALLVPGHTGHLAASLSFYDPFSLWQAALLAFGMIRVGKSSLGVGIAVALTILTVPALLVGVLGH
ncbi:MAG TPA: YIP1 family protein [Candidatus Baltobacteraceae bacterium]|jgi:hypothetical protein|nr:YIP1 family protein [Candidatus Baltobacteraceae bacterium]